ncbi:MAG: hypothetical protein AAGG75_09655 [Bacteroidota bacterium]
MDNFTILNLQNFAAFLMTFLGLKWWVFPRVANLSIHKALIPFVFLHSIRYLGMMFMVEHQIYDEFPKDVATVIGLWDYTTAILAIITTYALRVEWKFAIPLVWFFNIFGFMDLVNAFPNVFGLEFYNYDIGGIWFMFIIVGPFTMISHLYIFYRLFKNFNTSKVLKNA